MTSHEKIAIGLDLGTSSLKALAVGVESGSVLFRERQAYPTHRPEAGASEQAPQDWIAAAIGALARLAAVTNTDDWVGIGLSAMLPTLVCLDADGEPLGNAIVWEDTRAEAQAAQLRREHGDAVAYERTGQPFDGRYLVPMFLRLEETDPALAARTVRIAGAKDYVFAQLTGQLLTDPSTAAGSGVYDLRTGEYAHGPWPALPEVAESTTTRGLDAGVARLIGAHAGTPVALGGADSVLGAEALGVREEGDIAIISGTSTVVLGARDTLEIAPGGRALVTPFARGGFGLEMDLVATGSAFSWLAGLTGAPSVDALIAEGEAVPLEAAPSVLPYLGPGEQGALSDPNIFAAFQGLTLGTTRGALMRGLLTGVVLELTRCVRAIAGSRDGRIIASGSSLSSPAVLQDLADACGREVVADLSDANHSGLGAIDVLLDALGMSRPTQTGPVLTCTPRPERSETWRRIAARHDADLARERERAAAGRDAASGVER